MNLHDMFESSNQTQTTWNGKTWVSFSMHYFMFVLHWQMSKVLFSDLKLRIVACFHCWAARAAEGLDDSVAVATLTSAGSFCSGFWALTRPDLRPAVVHSGSEWKLCNLHPMYFKLFGWNVNNLKKKKMYFINEQVKTHFVIHFFFFFFLFW